jgi:hypothetical protein
VDVYPTIIGKLSYVAMLTIVDESSVEALGGYDAALRNPKCTTGPYFFDEWVDGQYIRIVRNDDYWGEPGYYKYIQFTWKDDSTAKAMSVGAGDSNWAVEIDSADKLAVDSGMYPGCRTYTTSGGGTNVLFFNTTNEYLSNELVREAITYAVDRNYINQVGTDNTGKVADSIISSASPYYKSPDAQREADVEKAKELLAEAGYAEGEIHLTLPAVPPTLAVSNAIAANLIEAGIDATHEVPPLVVHRGNVRNPIGLIAIAGTGGLVDRDTRLSEAQGQAHEVFGGVVGGDHLRKVADDARKIGRRRLRYLLGDAGNHLSLGLRAREVSAREAVALASVDERALARNALRALRKMLAPRREGLRHVHPNTSQTVDNLHEPIEADLHVMRYGNASKLRNGTDHARHPTVGIGGVEFAGAIPLDVDHRIARDGDEIRHALIGVKPREDDDVTACAFDPRPLVRSDDEDVEGVGVRHGVRGDTWGCKRLHELAVLVGIRPHGIVEGVNPHPECGNDDDE